MVELVYKFDEKLPRVFEKVSQSPVVGLFICQARSKSPDYMISELLQFYKHNKDNLLISKCEMDNT